MRGLVPPHDLDAEAAVVSAVLLDGRALDRVVDIVTPEYFYSDPNGWIFRAARELAATGAPVDEITVSSWLRDRDRLRFCGGAEYITELAVKTPARAHIEAHAQIVKDKFLLRKLIEACRRIMTEGYGDVGGIQEFIQDAESSILRVCDLGTEDADTPTMRDVLIEVFRDLQSEDADPGVRTGLIDLDRLLGPMRPGNLVIVAAHTGIGKTSLALLMCLDAAIHPALIARRAVRQGVLIFSHEMTRYELGERALFSRARVNTSKMARKGSILPTEWTALAEEANALALDNLWIDDRPALSPDQIRSKARRIKVKAAKQGTPLRLIVVDYLQLVNGSGGGKHAHERREREIAYASEKLKQLAKELSLPVVLLAQLNDDSRREKRPPNEHDLRECKAAAHAADKLILIHNPAADARARAVRRGAEVDRPIDAEPVDLIVAKNRGMAKGTVPALFFPSYTLFADAEDTADER